MNGEEWDIFERIEKLEGINPELKEINSVATMGFVLAFISRAKENPHDARKLKDKCIAIFKKQGVSTKRLDSIGKTLLTLCEKIEK